MNPDNINLPPHYECDRAICPEGSLPSATTLDEIATHIRDQQWEKMESKALTVVTQHPEQALGWKILSKALIKLEKWTQAVDVLNHVGALSPSDSDAFNDLGFALYCTGCVEEAESNYRRALKLNPLFAEACSNLSSLLIEQGRLVEALVNLQLSLRINPSEAILHNSLGNTLRYFGRLNESEASYRCALELNPENFEAHLNLGITLKDLGKFIESLSSYCRALEINPGSDHAFYHMGVLLHTIGGRNDEAIACLQQAISINPNNITAYHLLGSIMLSIGQRAKSMALFRHAQETSPLITWKTLKKKADFSVVLLDAPGGGCTPVNNYLVRKAPYDCHFYCVLPDSPHHIDLIRANADVVINLIADADHCKDILPFALDLVENLGLPVVNHPRLIIKTDRETVAQRLSGMPMCRIPKTVRITGAALAEAAANRSIHCFTLPLLIRIVGTHGGDDFEMFNDMDAIADFVSKRPAADYYLIEYLDYRSADGFFRKYRLISIDGKLLPYHLAIYDQWKVHHFRTDMANQAWMREEEGFFLSHPHSVFNESQQAVLFEVAAAMGLDYGGIDCALDRDGRIVVFETNAAMLVHDEVDVLFAYKNPFIAKIKDAFNAMLNRLASSATQGNRVV